MKRKAWEIINRFHFWCERTFETRKSSKTIMILVTQINGKSTVKTY